MNNQVDPKLFKFHSSTKLRQVGTNQFEIVIDRKSRIIMKDGNAIVTKVNKIKASVPDAKVNLRTSAPICSKTKLFLENQNIEVNLF